jgi:hypothetical protein
MAAAAPARSRRDGDDDVRRARTHDLETVEAHDAASAIRGSASTKRTSAASGPARNFCMTRRWTFTFSQWCRCNGDGLVRRSAGDRPADLSLARRDAVELRHRIATRDARRGGAPTTPPLEP